MGDTHTTTTLWNAIAWSAFFYFDTHTEEGFNREVTVAFWVPFHLLEKYVMTSTGNLYN